MELSPIIEIFYLKNIKKELPEERLK